MLANSLEGGLKSGQPCVETHYLLHFLHLLLHVPAHMATDESTRRLRSQRHFISFLKIMEWSPHTFPQASPQIHGGRK